MTFVLKSKRKTANKFLLILHFGMMRTEEKMNLCMFHEKNVGVLKTCQK